MALLCGLTSVMVVQPAWAADVATDGGGYAHAGVPAGPRIQATPAASTGTGWAIQGIDVSSHDHTKGPINWPGVAASGIKFAYVKATEGNSYLNPYFHDDYTQAKAAGILTGAYTYARPDHRNPVAEADYFINNAEWINDSRTLIPFLDIEWPWYDWPGRNAKPTPAPKPPLWDCYGLTPAQMVDWIRAFVDRVRVQTGRYMMIYTNTNWWNPCTGNNASFGHHPLDLASYSTNPPTALPSGWSRFAIWQYAAGNPSIAGNFDRDAFNGDRAALAQLTGDGSGPVSLRARGNGKYVSAERAAALPLVANRPGAGSWETFEQVNVGGGYVALRSRVNGRYVTAENAGKGALIARGTWAGTWEQFTLGYNSNGSISLRAKANGRYVSASNGGSQLIANRTGIGTWEQFDLRGLGLTAAPPPAPAPPPAAAPPPAVGSGISLRATVNGRFVTAENAGRSALIARGTWPGSWERFDMAPTGGGYVSLRSRVNGRYVSSQRGGLIANSTRVGSSEQFRVVNNGDGTVSLQLRANGRYVTAERAGKSQLIARGTWAGSWERFVIS